MPVFGLMDDGKAATPRTSLEGFVLKELVPQDPPSKAVVLNGLQPPTPQAEQRSRKQEMEKCVEQEMQGILGGQTINAAAIAQIIANLRAGGLGTTEETVQEPPADSPKTEPKSGPQKPCGQETQTVAKQVGEPKPPAGDGMPDFVL